jgi:hypothetical protein
MLYSESETNTRAGVGSPAAGKKSRSDTGRAKADTCTKNEQFLVQIQRSDVGCQNHDQSFAWRKKGFKAFL